MRDQSAHPVSVIVALPAEIDFASQDQAYEQLRAAVAGGAQVVIGDLTATTFCDCSSLRRLAAIRHQATGGSQLRLAITPGSAVHRTAQLMDLDHLLPIYPSAAQAAAAGSLPYLNASGSRLPRRVRPGECERLSHRSRSRSLMLVIAALTCFRGRGVFAAGRQHKRRAGSADRPAV